MTTDFDLGRIQGVVCDIDGTLLRGDRALPGVGAFFKFLADMALPLVIATNNATRPPEHYVEQLANAGCRIGVNQVMTAALATVPYLCQRFENGALVYVIGEEGLMRALRDAGFTLVPNARHAADVVVVGGDTHLTYTKLKDAVLLLQRGAMLVGTNPDMLIPVDEGLVPEAGTTLAALTAATGVEATIIGKPAPHLFAAAVQRLSCPPQEVVMIGDRLETDILGAQSFGLRSVLVETGVDSASAVAATGIRPDAVYADLRQLADSWRAARHDAKHIRR